jgi:hypothetical protein
VSSEKPPVERDGQSQRSPEIGRREVLKGIAAAGVASVLGALPACRPARRPALIHAENSLPGTSDWLLKNPRLDPNNRFRCPWVEGYCSRRSLKAGERLAFMISADPPSPVLLDVYRLGYYGGSGGRHLLRLGPLAAHRQPEAPIGAERLRDCQWEPAAEITIPEEWPSGVYLGKLTAERDGIQSYLIFIVRDDRPCDLLFQCSDNTWQAYNRWPSTWSLYDDGVKPWYWGPGVQVSFNRPYGFYRQMVRQPLSTGSGEFLLWEFPLAFWLERHGYDVSYISNADTHADAAGLLRAKLWLSVGHDEYWTLAMHDNVRAARDAGLNLAFLSGNTCYGVVEMRGDRAGAFGRVLRRVGQFGPIEPRWVAEGFPEVLRLRGNGPDESLLIGARSGYPVTGCADWTCVAPQHWLFAGTAMARGDSIPNLVGWEWHGNPAPIAGLEVVAAGDVVDHGVTGRYAATIYPPRPGNFVFNAATIWWADAMAAPPGYRTPHLGSRRPAGPDQRVQRITANLIERAREGPRAL